MRTTFAIVAAVLVMCCSALPTSILVDVKADSIIIAADSEKESLGLDEHGILHEERPSNICKLAVAGNIVFAVHGHGTGGAAGVSWDAVEVAKQAIGRHPSLNSPWFLPHSMGPDELFLATNDWASEMGDKLTKLNHSNPGMLRSMIAYNRPRSWQPKANADKKSFLLSGFFAGNVRGALRAYVVALYFNESSQTVTRSTPRALESLHASSPTTEELITGTGARAKRVRAHAAKITPEWRRDACLIQASEKYDRYVGGPVNVIEIPLGQAPHWLQNETCK